MEILDDATAEWLQAEARSLRAKEKETSLEGLSSLYSDSEEDDEDVEDWARVFGVERLMWRGLKTHASVLSSGHGDIIWPASEYVAEVLAPTLKGKVLELGAGTALPSIVAARHGCHVLATDAKHAASIASLVCTARIHSFRVRPLQWGLAINDKFDVVLACDCIYNPRDHQKLLETIDASLKPEGHAVIAFALHGNAADEEVLSFFDTALQRFHVDKRPSVQRSVTDSMRTHLGLDCEDPDPERAARARKRALVHVAILRQTTPSS